MQSFTSLSDVPADFGPSAVTFGKFDGVHLGHRAMISALREFATEAKLVTTVVTFDRNPLALLDPARCPESITSLPQKRELLERAGAEVMLQLAFDREFSALSAEDFVTRVLVDALHARVVLVGPDPRFGAGGRGHLELLTALGEERGLEVHQLAPRSDAASRISSTRIRSLLGEGRVAEASALLGRHPSVRGVVVRGQQRGRELGYPTANLSPALEGFIPADGVYAGYLTVISGPERVGERMPAAISIGNNPTFEGVPARQVEAYVIDEELDLYGAVVAVEFSARVRGMEKFDSLDALIARMGIDVREVKAALALSP